MELAILLWAVWVRSQTPPWSLQPSQGGQRGVRVTNRLDQEVSSKTPTLQIQGISTELFLWPRCDELRVCEAGRTDVQEREVLPTRFPLGVSSWGGTLANPGSPCQANPQLITSLDQRDDRDCRDYGRELSPRKGPETAIYLLSYLADRDIWLSQAKPLPSSPESPVTTGVTRSWPVLHQDLFSPSRLALDRNPSTNTKTQLSGHNF